MSVGFSLPPIIWVLPGVCERHNAAVSLILRAYKQQMSWFLNLTTGAFPAPKLAVRGLELALDAGRQSQNLVPMAEAKEAIRRVLEPLREMLDGMPKAFAIQANPADPQMAEDAAREALDNVYRMIQKNVK